MELVDAGRSECDQRVTSAGCGNFRVCPAVRRLPNTLKTIVLTTPQYTMRSLYRHIQIIQGHYVYSAGMLP
jgi:hypothetical protein